MSDKDNAAESNQLSPRVLIRVAQLGELKAYVVYEHELDALDRLDAELTQPLPESIYLNFALVLLPTAVSFLISLLTTKIEANRIYTVFVVIAVLCFLIGLVLLALWKRDRHSHHQSRQRLVKEREKQIETIKNRLPPNPPSQFATILPEE